MRNLKRALSLGLASAMVLGTMAFNASAASAKSVIPTSVTTDYQDNDTIGIDNLNAVYIADQIALMKGEPGGNFDPTGSVSRVQMAVICVNMKYGNDYAAANFDNSGKTIFSDISEEFWGAGYINVAVADGIIAGVGDGKFDPDAPVRAADAMLMVMKTLGYFQGEGELGDVSVPNSYQVAAGLKATSLKLYDGAEFPLNEYLNREDVCAIAVRALTLCAEVNYNPSTNTYYNAASNYDTGVNVNNDFFEHTLGWKSFNLKVEDFYDDFNRPTKLWSIDYHNVANFVLDPFTNQDAVEMEYTESVSVMELAGSLSTYTHASNADKYDFAIYVDGVEYTQWYESQGYDKDFGDLENSTTTYQGFIDIINEQSAADFLASGNGALTQVFVIPPRTEYDWSTQGLWVPQEKPGEVIISVVNTHLGIVTDSSANTDGTSYTTTVTFYSNYLQSSDGTRDGLEYKTIERQVVSTEQFDRGDVVACTVSGVGYTSEGSEKNYNNDLKIVDINIPETVGGEVTARNSSANNIGGAWIEVDDDTENRVYYNVAMRGNIDISGGEMSPDGLGGDISIFVDEYGYALGYQINDLEQSYLYLEYRDGDGWSGINGVTAQVTFADGTDDWIKITQIDGEGVDEYNHSKIPFNSRFLDSDGNIASANENFRVDTANYSVDETVIEKRIFGYNELADGTYNLSTSIHEDDSFLEVNPETGKLVDLDAPDRGTMAVFTSVRYADGVQNTLLMQNANSNTIVYEENVAQDYYDDSKKAPITTDWRNFKYSDAILLQHGTEVLDGPAGDNGVYNIGNDSSRYVYALVEDAGGMISYKVTAKDGGLTEYDDVFDPAYDDGKTLLNTTESGYKTTALTKDSQDGDWAFRVDNQTIFYDVVNNEELGVGFSGIDNLKDGNVNMQVLFGSNGCADMVFVNFGMTQDAGGDDVYFITDNTSYDQIKIDGVAYYTYTVYEDGEQIKLYSLDELGDFLQVNTLYKIEDGATETDGGYIIGSKKLVEAIICYDVAATSAISDYFANHGGYTDDFDFDNGDLFHTGWSVATQASYGNLYLKWNIHSDVEEGVKETNVFSYDDDTKFVELRYDEYGKISSIKLSDSSAINTFDTGSTASNLTTSWIDVVFSDLDQKGNWAAPYAETVYIIQPNHQEDLYNGSVGSSTTDIAGMNYEKVKKVSGSGNSEDSPYVLAGAIYTDGSEVDGTGAELVYAMAKNYLKLQGWDVDSLSFKSIGKGTNLADIEFGTDIVAGGYEAFEFTVTGLDEDEDEMTKYFTITFTGDDSTDAAAGVYVGMKREVNSIFESLNDVEDKLEASGLTVDASNADPVKVGELTNNSTIATLIAAGVTVTDDDGNELDASDLILVYYGTTQSADENYVATLATVNLAAGKNYLTVEQFKGLTLTQLEGITSVEAGGFAGITLTVTGAAVDETSAAYVKEDVYKVGSNLNVTYEINSTYLTGKDTYAFVFEGATNLVTTSSDVTKVGDKLYVKLDESGDADEFNFNVIATFVVGKEDNNYNYTKKWTEITPEEG